MLNNIAMGWGAGDPADVATISEGNTCNLEQNMGTTISSNRTGSFLKAGPI
jgi:hypothetical protein